MQTAKPCILDAYTMYTMRVAAFLFLLVAFAAVDAATQKLVRTDFEQRASLKARQGQQELVKITREQLDEDENERSKTRYNPILAFQQLSCVASRLSRCDHIHCVCKGFA